MSIFISALFVQFPVLLVDHLARPVVAVFQQSAACLHLACRADTMLTIRFFWLSWFYRVILIGHLPWLGILSYK